MTHIHLVNVSIYTSLELQKEPFEAFDDLVMGHNPRISKTKTRASVGKLAQELGGHLSRQSDRDFPRNTKFTTPILVHTKKEGSSTLESCSCLIVAIVSGSGRSQLIGGALLSAESIIALIGTLELTIVGMDGGVPKTWSDHKT
jgi:hypothetical protein